MPVDGTQPVYPPQTLTPITSVWGQAVSDSVVQKFASTTDRTNKWVNPPAGSLSTIIGSGVIDVYRKGVWLRMAEGAGTKSPYYLAFYSALLIVDAANHVHMSHVNFNFGQILGGMMSCERQTGDSPFGVFISETTVSTDKLTLTGRMVLINFSNGTVQAAGAGSNRICHGIAWGTEP